MIAEQKQTHIAYRCPHCGMAVLGFVGNFALSADMLKLKCPCGKSELTITYTSDKKIRLLVPCVFCENPHHFVVSQTLFFGRELFHLNCPYANMDICFIGKEEKISEAVEKSAEELNLLYQSLGAQTVVEEESRVEGEQSLDEEEYIPDPEVYDVVRFLVRELEYDGAIHCPCQNGAYDFAFTKEGIRIFCPECGAEYIFCAGSVESAQAFLHCDELRLVYKSKKS